MGRYRKVECRIWDDEKFRSWSRDGKLVFLFLLTHPSMTSIGGMRTTMAGLAAEIGMTEKEWREALSEPLRNGCVMVSEPDHYLYLPNFLRYNPPENLNVAKGWANAMNSLPDCLMKTDHLQRVRESLMDAPEPLRNGFETLLKPLRTPGTGNREQGTVNNISDDVIIGNQCNHDVINAHSSTSSSTSKGIGCGEGEFETWWKLYPRKLGKQASANAWRARIREGRTPQELTDALKNYLEDIRLRGTEETYIKHGSTFLGVQKGFADYLPGVWVPPVVKSKPADGYFETFQGEEER